MISKIKQFFEANLAGAQKDDLEHKLQIASAALLFEIGRSDFSIKDDERRKIQHLIQKQFGLSDEETETLTRLAEQQAEESTSLHGFTSLINATWSLEQRSELVEFMWAVAYADEHLDAHELHLMRKIGSLLHIPHKRFVATKMRARQRAHRD